MQKNSGDFSMQEAMRLANSSAGQELLALLRQSDPKVINKAMEQALRGDIALAKDTLRSVTASPEVQNLMKRLEE